MPFEPARAGAEAGVNLAGEWTLALDRDDVGVQQQWFDRSLADRIQLPGSLQEQGFGDSPSVDSPWTGTLRPEEWDKPKYAPYRKPGAFKMPFWLQPEKVYVGPAWYQREVVIDPSWADRRVVLHLERCHWFSRVWLDGAEIGQRDSLSTPHQYDMTAAIAPGRHRLTIRADNRVLIGVGVNSHSVTDHTQSNWNGITGKIALLAGPKTFIDKICVYPDVKMRAARVVLTIGSINGRVAANGDVSAKVTLRARCGDHTPAAVMQEFGVPAAGGEVEAVVPLGEAAKLWDEFHPDVYSLTATVETADGVDERTTTFGLREIAVKNKRFVLNGRPIMFRGTLECCIFPLTGYPPTDVESWKRVVRVCKQHGLNHMRFHSHCPPEAAFVAADELGFFFQVECASWANQGSGLGLGQPIDAWIYSEADRIRRAYGNHPSFVLMAYGNEPGGPGRGGEFLGPWVDHQKAVDSRRLYTSAAGWPMIAENQYHNAPQPRIQGWGDGLKSRINSRRPETITDYRDFIEKQDVPVISHEIGQWCVYPNFEETGKYTGVLKAKNFEVFRDFLNAKHMGDQARDFVMASGKLQTLCYKEEIESALRTPGFGGFQLLDLHDFPGQGTALVGVLDPFWDSKPYVTAAEFRRFCNATVPLARMGKRTWTNDETFTADVEVAHFGEKPLKAIQPQWLLTHGTREVASGRMPTRDIPRGNAIQLGRIELPLSRFQQPMKLTLTVTLPETDFANDWDIWVYPAQVGAETIDDVTVVSELDRGAIAKLNSGGKVLLLSDPRSVAGDIKIGFSSIFWNTAWTGGQAPHTLGILCDPRHPALAMFPTEYHSNWQWWELVSRSGAMILDALPQGLRPIVQVVPDWFEPRRLGLLFEARVHAGKLMVCSIDLETNLTERPAARQMRYSLIRYMSGKTFDPQIALTEDQIRGLLREPPAAEKSDGAVR
ncbi:MAG: glycoside hydrolase [Rhodopirellula sp.]|nr:glycoside hydrolase [Rhodopirellula sp.]